MNISPLRYPGGKSRAIHKITKYFPKEIGFISSHFIGGGSIELYMSNQNIKIKAYDNFYLLINFWNQLKYNKDNLYDSVIKYLPLNKSEFYELQSSILKEKDCLNMATKFYVLNRCSFSGSTLSGGMSPNHPRFNMNIINKLLNMNLDNIEFKCLDFEDSILKHKGNFKYLDPPYYIENNLYGVKGASHREFNHLKLNQILKTVDNWILSYNDCEYIRSLYGEYEIVELDWSYGMSKNKKSKEIIIINYKNKNT